MRSLFALPVLLAALAAAPGAQAADRHVQIINRTGQTMTEFYASNTKAKSWQEDILGRDTLDHGSSVNININDGTGACKFDFKAVFADGRSVERAAVDVCRISSFTFNR